MSRRLHPAIANPSQPFSAYMPGLDGGLLSNDGGVADPDEFGWIDWDELCWSGNCSDEVGGEENGGEVVEESAAF